MSLLMSLTDGKFWGFSAECTHSRVAANKPNRRAFGALKWLAFFRPNRTRWMFAMGTIELFSSVVVWKPIAHNGTLAFSLVCSADRSTEQTRTENAPSQRPKLPTERRGHELCDDG